MAEAQDRLRQELEHHLDQWENELSSIPAEQSYDDVKGHLRSWMSEGRALLSGLAPRGDASPG